MKPPYKILFLCTGNSCRSQMAEAVTRKIGGDRVIAHSAGSRPAGYIHPLAIEAMQRLDVPLGDQCSKSWNEFADEDHDIIITLCDSAAAETCPTWPGRPATAHWGLPDPTFQPGSDADRLEAAIQVGRLLQRRIKQLLELPLETLTPQQLKAELKRLGEVQPATRAVR